MKEPLRGKTYRDVVRHYGIDICESQVGCEAGFSRVAHYRGRYANGVVHCARLDYRAQRTRLSEILVLVAEHVLRLDEAAQPLWMKIYQANTWAMREAKDVWRIQLSTASQMKARKKVLHLARITHVRLRYHHPAVYQWARIARSGDNHDGSTKARPARVDAQAEQAVRVDGSDRDHDQ